jgi:hypothetical protein
VQLNARLLEGRKRIRLDVQSSHMIFATDDISIAVVNNQRNIERAFVYPIASWVQFQVIQVDGEINREVIPVLLLGRLVPARPNRNNA